MKLSNRKWYTPEEVRMIVYDGLISVSTVRNMCNRGEIPCERVGGAVDANGAPRRRKFLIPVSFVKEMLAKAGRGNDEAAS